MDGAPTAGGGGAEGAERVGTRVGAAGGDVGGGAGGDVSRAATAGAGRCAVARLSATGVGAGSCPTARLSATTTAVVTCLDVAPTGAGSSTRAWGAAGAGGLTCAGRGVSVGPGARFGGAIPALIRTASAPTPASTMTSAATTSATATVLGCTTSFGAGRPGMTFMTRRCKTHTQPDPAPRLHGSTSDGSSLPSPGGEAGAVLSTPGRGGWASVVRDDSRSRSHRLRSGDPSRFGHAAALQAGSVA